MTNSNSYQQLLLDGSVNIPFSLIKLYAQLGLTDDEVLLLIHLIAFADKEGNRFPTFEEITQRVKMDHSLVVQSLQKLLKSGWLSIDEQTDVSTGMQCEVYNLTLMYDRLVRAPLQEVVKPIELNPTVKQRSLYHLFETEFARPLSPMECEMIEGWEAQDQYPRELIVHALKEAVFAGKLHFRYIDRILLDWQNHRIRTVEQAKAHSQQFRMERK